ncbi:MAG TPA: hypothetical protein VMU32_07805 [Solirubrobacteraceae bacterium]|nr:hypothetical protein [Solirubrobacteraceae bacterium]
MRFIKVAMVLALCALGLMATQAGAAQFTASRLPKPLSESEPGPTRGLGIGSTELGGTERSQEFKFGPFRIYCAAKAYGRTIAEGAVSWGGSQAFSTELLFQKCLTKASFSGYVAGVKTQFDLNAEKKSEPVKFVYHVNGVADLGAGETESEVEVGSGTASFTIASKVCKIDWPRQVVPAKSLKAPEGTYSSATYSNTEVPVEEKLKKRFPGGLQQKLVIANEFKGMEWSFEEGQCLGEGGFEEAAKNEEGKSALYRGSLEEEVKGGNLGFEEAILES